MVEHINWICLSRPPPLNNLSLLWLVTPTGLSGNHHSTWALLIKTIWKSITLAAQVLYRTILWAGWVINISILLSRRLQFVFVFGFFYKMFKSSKSPVVSLLRFVTREASHSHSSSSALSQETRMNTERAGVGTLQNRNRCPLLEMLKRNLRPTAFKLQYRQCLFSNLTKSKHRNSPPGKAIFLIALGGISIQGYSPSDLITPSIHRCVPICLLSDIFNQLAKSSLQLSNTADRSHGWKINQFEQN